MMKRKKSVKIKEIRPSILLRGGIIEIELDKKLPVWDLEEGDFIFENNAIRLIAASPTRLIGEVLYFSEDKSKVPFFIETSEYKTTMEELNFPVKLSENHIFGSSPVSDVHGNIYFIDLKEFQKNQQSVVYKYSVDDGRVYPYVSGIGAPSSLAYFEGVLYITSMVERKLYRCFSSGEYELFSQGLGSAYGLAVNSLGAIFVGDQTGSLFKVDSTGRASFYAAIPESFKGYHFTFSSKDELYFTVPSSVGKNYIYRLNAKKELELILETMNVLGALAFSEDGSLYWAENSREEGMIYRLSPEQEKEKVVSGSFMLGLHFNPKGDLITSDLNNLYLINNELLRK